MAWVSLLVPSDLVSEGHQASGLPPLVQLSLVEGRSGAVKSKYSWAARLFVFKAPRLSEASWAGGRRGWRQGRGHLSHFLVESPSPCCDGCEGSGISLGCSGSGWGPRPGPPGSSFGGVLPVTLMERLGLLEPRTRWAQKELCSSVFESSVQWEDKGLCILPTRMGGRKQKSADGIYLGFLWGPPTL